MSEVHSSDKPADGGLTIRVFLILGTLIAA